MKPYQVSGHNYRNRAVTLVVATLTLPTCDYLQVALWGFGPNNNIYTCFPVDRLHQDHNGVSKHLLEALEAYLQHEYGASRAAEMLSLVNHRLAQMRPLHEAFYPSDGLAAEIAMAEERRGLMKFLPVACYGLVEQTVVDLLAGKLPFESTPLTVEYVELLSSQLAYVQIMPAGSMSGTVQRIQRRVC